MVARRLETGELLRRCDPAQFDFETTSDLEPLADIVGQDRAVEAVRFGIDIRQEGYNIFVLGPPGTGKLTLVRQFLEQRAPGEPTPDDWCYVNNFDQSHKPLTLRLPAGRGQQLRRDVAQLVDDVRRAVATAFESEEYREHRQELQERYERQQERLFHTLTEEAHERGLVVMRTPVGLAFAPRKGRGPMSSEELEQLSEAKRSRIRENVQEMDRRAQRLLDRLPRLHREAQQKLSELDREVARQAITPLFEELERGYTDLPDVIDHLQAMLEDLVERAEDLLKLHRAEREQEDIEEEAALPLAAATQGIFRRYRVNVLVEHEPDSGAPVVHEDNPTYQNLIGRVEHIAQMGALVTDFSLLKPGSLHQASGGYLILDAQQVLMQPLVWDALKRTLRRRAIRIESLHDMLGVLTTTTLEPEPIPLDVKVVLLGPPLLYYLLREYDPEFAELFKVPADFDTEMDRDPGSQQLYAKLVATLVRKEALRPFGRSAVARVIEHAARLTGDAAKLSVHMRSVADLLHEASYYARRAGHDVVEAAHVQEAIDAQIARISRVPEQLKEMIHRGLLHIETDGEQVGQINALAVLRLGDVYFGRPSRVTARTRLGSGELLDIEREVEMGEATHSKGVLILAGFLTGRYARELPLSLGVSLVFEQSYAGIAGDSASTAELCAILSAIAELPLTQAIAVTGSVDQQGRVQAVGGVNEKIEGFFDVCSRRGLTGGQGVILPAANAQHLALRQDVLDAAAEGCFHVWTVETVDEAMERLTGVTAGEPDAEGNYPPDSVNGRIAARLAELAARRQRFSQPNIVIREDGEEEDGDAAPGSPPS
ncbi:MAG: Lon protease family protein [Phycisphaeraceae bacterium]